MVCCLLGYLKEHNANLDPGKGGAFPILDDVDVLSLNMKRVPCVLKAI